MEHIHSLLRATRHFISPQTDFLHRDDLISIRDNLLLSYLMMLQKTQDGVLEGKSLLKRLLAFQGERGNFPLYLHQFPSCFHQWNILECIPVLNRILNEFGSFLGDEVAKTLRKSIEKGEEQLAYLETFSPLPSFQRWKLNPSSPLPPLTSKQEVLETFLINPSLTIPYLSSYWDADLGLYLGVDDPLAEPFTLEKCLGGKSELLTTEDLILALFTPPIPTFPQLPQAPFRITPKSFFWKGLDQNLHALRTISKNGTQLVDGQGWTLELFSPYEEEHEREWEFAIDRRGITHLVAGFPSTTFTFDTSLKIEKWNLVFSIEEGFGDFRVHIRFGGEKGNDLIISVRTLRRSDHVKLKLCFL